MNKLKEQQPDITELETVLWSKSACRIIAPISSEISRLLRSENYFQNGNRKRAMLEMSSHLEELSHASDDFIEIMKNFEESSSEVAVLIGKLTKGKDILKYCIEEFITASSEEIYENVLQSSKSFLIICIEALTLWDKFKVEEISLMIEAVLQDVEFLQKNNINHKLVDTFKSFIQHMLKLSKLIDQRQQDLNEFQQKEQLIILLFFIEDIVPVFGSALANRLRFPLNAQAKLGCQYVGNNMRKMLNQILQILQTAQDPEKSLFCSDFMIRKPGQFIFEVDKLTQLIADDPENINDGRINELLSSILQFALTIHHELSEGTSQQLLICSNKVLNLRENLRNIYNEDTKLDSEVNDCCNKLIDSLEELEKIVNHSILTLIINSYLDPFLTLDQLFTKLYSSEACITAELDTFKKKLHDEVELLCHVASYASSCSNDKTQIYKIYISIQQLEELDAEIDPAIAAYITSPQEHATVNHLKFLNKEFHRIVSSISNSLNKILDLGMFFKMTVAKMRELLNVKDISFLSGYKLKMFSMYSQWIIHAIVGQMLNGDIKNASEEMKNSFDTIESVNASVKIIAQGKLQKQKKQELAESFMQLFCALHSLSAKIEEKTDNLKSTLFVDDICDYGLEKFPSNVSRLPVDITNGNCSASVIDNHFGNQSEAEHSNEHELVEKLKSFCNSYCYAKAGHETIPNVKVTPALSTASNEISTPTRLRDLQLTCFRISRLRQLTAEKDNQAKLMGEKLQFPNCSLSLMEDFALDHSTEATSKINKSETFEEFYSCSIDSLQESKLAPEGFNFIGHSLTPDCKKLVQLCERSTRLSKLANQLEKCNSQWQDADFCSLGNKLAACLYILSKTISLTDHKMQDDLLSNVNILISILDTVSSWIQQLPDVLPKPNNTEIIQLDSIRSNLESLGMQLKVSVDIMFTSCNDISNSLLVKVKECAINVLQTFIFIGTNYGTQLSGLKKNLNI